MSCNWFNLLIDGKKFINQSNLNVREKGEKENMILK
jgi:hypothetical protein